METEMTEIVEVIDYSSSLIELNNTLNNVEILLYIIVWSIFIFISYKVLIFIYRKIIMKWIKYLFKFQI